jgi:hypothetical protein
LFGQQINLGLEAIEATGIVGQSIQCPTRPVNANGIVVYPLSLEGYTQLGHGSGQLLDEF